MVPRLDIGLTRLNSVSRLSALVLGAGLAMWPLAPALALDGGEEFSILDYLDNDIEQLTPYEWSARGDAAVDLRERYQAFDRALSGYNRGALAGEVSGLELNRARLDLLEAALALALDETSDQAGILVDRARQLIRDMPNPLDQGWGYWSVVQAQIQLEQVGAGVANLRRAALVAEEIEDPALRSLLQKALGQTALLLGEIEQASFLLLSISEASGREELARAVVQARAAAGGLPALQLEVTDAFFAAEDSRGQRDVLISYADALGRADLTPVGIELALSIGDFSEQGDALAEVAKVALEIGKADFARVASLLNPDAGEATRSWLRLSRQLQDFGYLLQAETARESAYARATGAGGDGSDIAQVAKAYIGLGEFDRARAMLEAAPQKDPAVIDMLVQLALAMAQSGSMRNFDSAIALAETDSQRQQLQTELSIQAARGGDVAGAGRSAEAITDPALQDRVLIEMAEAQMNENRFSEAEQTARRINDPVDQSETLANLAKEMIRNGRDADGEALFEAIHASAHDYDQETADRINRKLAKSLADALMNQRALDVAQEVQDAELRQDAYVNVARVIGKTDPDAALALIGNLADQSYADQLLADACLALVKAGRVEMAVRTATQIVNDRVRVETMRKITEEQALRLDIHNLFDPTRPEPATGVMTAGDVRRAGSVGTSRLYSIEGEVRSGALPSLPDRWFEIGADGIVGVSGDDVRADVRPISPGRAEVAMMRQSYFNEKFISKVAGQTLMRQQQGRHSLEFIMIESGVFSLPTLLKRLQAMGHGDDVLHQDGRIYTLRLPLLVMPGATLVVTGADVESLRLSTERGAFIVNAGTVQIADTILESWDESTNQRTYRTYDRKKDFRPFVTTWTGGDIDVVGSTVFGLGYLGGKAYGLSMSAGPATVTKNRPMWEDAPTGRLIDNSFRNMFYAYYAYEATDAYIVGNELVDNIVYGLDPHDRAERLMMAYNTAYGTHKKHGIIISREVDDSWMLGNISFDNAGSGFMLDRDSHGNMLYANTSFDNEQDGISFFESSCNFIVGNHIFDNKRDGIKVRNSWNIALADNVIENNGAAGLDIYSIWLDPTGAHVTRDFDLDPYFAFTGVEVYNNTLVRNASGMKFVGVNQAIIGPNNIADQSPRIFAGDLVSLGGSVLSNVRDGKLAGLAHQCAQEVPPEPCPFVDMGLLTGEGQGMLDALEDTGRCIPVSARPLFETAELSVDEGLDEELKETDE